MKKSELTKMIQEVIKEVISECTDFKNMNPKHNKKPVIEAKEEIKIENGGSGYTNIPQVTITGGGGSGATASAYIGSGSVKNIVITNSGSGFTSIPTITIDGVQDEGGTPPKVSIGLGNKKVRSLNI